MKHGNLTQRSRKKHLLPNWGFYFPLQLQIKGITFVESEDLFLMKADNTFCSKPASNIRNDNKAPTQKQMQHKLWTFGLKQHRRFSQKTPSSVGMYYKIPCFLHKIINGTPAQNSIVTGVMIEKLKTLKSMPKMWHTKFRKTFFVVY